jgi:hypothetical protein
MALWLEDYAIAMRRTTLLDAVRRWSKMSGFEKAGPASLT